MILVPSILGYLEEEPLLGSNKGDPVQPGFSKPAESVSFMQDRFVRTAQDNPLSNWKYLCFTQIPAQSTFSQDLELAVFPQKLKSDSVKL